jgi:hypothetical protein
MGDPMPIYQLYQQPAKPELTSSDHEVVATCRLSAMSEVGQNAKNSTRSADGPIPEVLATYIQR